MSAFTIADMKAIGNIGWMNRATALLLTLAMPSTAAEPEPYFAPDLETKFYTCSWEDGDKSHPIELLSEFQNEWYSAHLRAADEPSLYSVVSSGVSKGSQTIRFTWLRSFHPPVIVRVEGASNKVWRITAKELSGAGGYQPGEIKRKLSRQLKPEEVVRLTAMLSSADLPDDSGDCTIGVDGAEWIIERVDATGYHFIRRWSPDAGSVHDVGQFLVDLTGWRYKDIY